MRVLRFKRKIIMDAQQIAMMNAILGIARDFMVLYAPLLGLLGGMYFIFDWLHKIVFGKK